METLPQLKGVKYGHVIAQGASTVIRACKTIGSSSPGKVYAIKFIYEPLANSGIYKNQAQREIQLHEFCHSHPNVVDFYGHGGEGNWKYFAMELALGGDLFDKIEPDVGTDEDIAHLYFRQLISGVRYMHSRGVAHRDLKPENLFVDGDGNLKIGDFGFATMYRKKGGESRLSQTPCGSPPYLAPEVFSQKPYDPEKSDTWACAVILFALFCGNTPWDSATAEDPYYAQFVKDGGRVKDSYWDRIPIGALSLLRSIMRPEPSTRFSLDNVARHPWFLRDNPLLTEDTVVEPVELATRLMCKLRVDLPGRTKRHGSFHSIDSSESFGNGVISSTQPITRVALSIGASPAKLAFSQTAGASTVYDLVNEDLSQVQFTHVIPMTMSQKALRFNDICPQDRLTRFHTTVPMESVLQTLVTALHKMAIPTRPMDYMVEARSPRVKIPFLTGHGLRSPVNGRVVVTRIDPSMLEVFFEKVKGDPLEWRRLFKKVVMNCAEIIYVGDDY